MGKDNRDILEVYKGIEIRKSNVVRFRVGSNKFKELIDEVEKTGLSIPKIISISGKPCDKCKGICVISFNDIGEKIQVKRGILSDYTMVGNGTNILNKRKQTK